MIVSSDIECVRIFVSADDINIRYTVVAFFIPVTFEVRCIVSFRTTQQNISSVRILNSKSATERSEPVTPDLRLCLFGYHQLIIMQVSCRHWKNVVSKTGWATAAFKVCIVAFLTALKIQ